MSVRAKGGYKIIDLKNTNFTVDEASTVKGVYEALESSYRKPILLSNIVIGGVERSDRFIIFSTSEGNFVSENIWSAGYDTLRCTVTPDDEVTFTVNG